MTDAEWLAERREGACSSDIGNLLRIGFSSPKQVFLAKTEGKEIESTIRMRAGNHLEHLITELYEESQRVKLCIPKKRIEWLRNDKSTRMGASVDRIVFGAAKIVELKLVWGPCKGDWAYGLKESYWCQANHQMGVTGIKVADVAVLFAPYEFKVYENIQFNKEKFEISKQIVADFWKCVEAKEMPDDWDHPLADKIRSVARNVTAGRELVWGNSELVEIEDFLNTKNVAKQEDHLKKAILTRMGDAAVAHLPDGRQVIRQLVKSKRGDYVKLKIIGRQSAVAEEDDGEDF